MPGQDIKQLTGRLNTDDSEEVMPAGDHAMAYDVVFRGAGNNMRVENIKGLTEIPNTLLPSGTNITIGAFYDDKRQRNIYFNYNSAGNHAIYLGYLNTGQIVGVVEVGAGTDGDVLAFEPDVVIPNIDIIYGDDTQGDILYWLNSQGKPCKVNIDRALGTLGSYGTIQTSYLDVIKAPPQIPPAVVFEDDATVTVNNFRKKLMKFKYRYVYDDKDKSVWSAHSEIPLPIGYTDSNADLNADPSKNARVAIVVQTGKPNVKKIEIAACEGLSNVFGDFFLIKVIDKDAAGVADDSLTSLQFFNDEAYIAIDVPESIQPFDEVPRAANAQALLNGNVLAYGGILEGYDQITPDAEVTQETEEDIKSTQYPFIFVGNQSGNSGFGTGEILCKIIGQIPAGWIFHIYTTNEDVSYTALMGDTPTDVLAGLATAATGLGFTAASGAENITLTKANEALQRVYVEPAELEVALTAQAMVWDLSDETLTLTGLAAQYYLFPIGSNFTIDNATTPSFDGDYTSITSVEVSGADLVIQFTAPTIATGDTSFTGDILTTPGLTVTTSIINENIEWRNPENYFEIHLAAQYLSTVQNATFITIANYGGTPDLDGTWTVESVSISTTDPTMLRVYVSETVFAGNTGGSGDVIFVTPQTAGNPYLPSDCPTYDWSSRYAFGIEYFDAEGRTMGVVTDSSMSVQTIPYTDNNSTTDVFLPKIGLSIDHRPPIEAKYFHLLRTKNLSKSDFIQWISNATYKDADYAYVSIEVLNQYIVVNPQSDFLAWEFTPGDRIKFMKNLATGGIAYGTEKDYEIQASLTDTYVNGVLVEGQLLKIALPTTDTFFDFGGTSWANYLIEIYTPAKNVGVGLDQYYEFSERYMVGNPGTATRYHQGMLQNQAPNLSQPATFEFIKGDNYFTQRTLNMGNQIKYAYQSYTVEEAGAAWFLGMDLISSYDVQDYVVQGEEYVMYVPGTVQTYFIQVLNGTYTFNFTGSITIRLNTVDGDTDFIYIYITSVGLDGAAIDSIIIGTATGPFADNQVLTIPLSGTITRDASDGGYLNSFIPGTYDATSYTVVSGYLTVSEVGSEFTVGLQNPNYSFFYESAVNANGRAWVVDPEGRENYNPVLMRYGLAYQQDTNINQVNRFYSTNFDEYDRSKGDIRRFKARERFMRVFQAGGVGQVGIYNQIIKNANGDTQLIYTNTIITQNNIDYYEGEYGMGAGNTGLASNKVADYFVDPVRGIDVRVSFNGMTPISVENKGQYYLRSLMVPYNFTWSRTDGTVAKILKLYDYHEDECITILQGGSRTTRPNAIYVHGDRLEGSNFLWTLLASPIAGDTLTLTVSDTSIPGSEETFTYVAEEDDDAESMVLGILDQVNASDDFTGSLGLDSYVTITTVSGEDIAGLVKIGWTDAISIDSYAFAFHEGRNAYSSFRNYKEAEWALCAEETVYMWKDGKMYAQTNALRSNFFGVQYQASLTPVFNAQIAIRKAFLALALQSNQAWAVPAISTSMINPQTGMRQESSLIAGDFEVQEGLRYAALKYDINSRFNPVEGLNEGDQLVGQWLKCTFQYNGTDFAWWFLGYCHFSISGRNL